MRTQKDVEMANIVHMEVIQDDRYKMYMPPWARKRWK